MVRLTDKSKHKTVGQVVITGKGIVIEINNEPRDFDRHWPGHWLIGATHHGLHHAQFQVNHGLYFTSWDKWMRTESLDCHRLVGEKAGEKTVRD